MSWLWLWVLSTHTDNLIAFSLFTLCCFLLLTDNFFFYFFFLFSVWFCIIYPLLQAKSLLAMEAAAARSIPRTVEEIFKDFMGRRAAMIKALTTGIFFPTLPLFFLFSHFQVLGFLICFSSYTFWLTFNFAFFLFARCSRILPALQSWLGFLTFFLSLSFSIFACFLVCIYNSY